MPSTRSERENYQCIMEMMNVPVCEGLREIFKQEWDKHHGATKGVWDDTCISGNELYQMERTRLHAASPVLNLYKSGKRSEWDCTALVDAILYSNAITGHLAPRVYNKVNELRVLRNSLTHKLSLQHAMPDAAFDNAYKKVKNCFKVLKLSTANVERIVNYSKGKHLMTYISLAVFIIGLISSLSYYWFINAFETKSLFRHISTKPVHDVANRTRTVNAILEELHNLSIRNNRALTHLYISGNPGSGKSQLARLVGLRYGTNIAESWFRPSTSIFVMTLNGGSLHDIYESYADFARRVDCNENNIASIRNSNQTSTKTKIQSLKTEISKMLRNFKGEYNWLLIVDNVAKLSEISSFLPQLEDEDWRGGQVLITTQDKSPPNGSLTVHISVSEGMDPAESCEFLTSLSGLAENQDLVGEVANELDYQPLALASAAFYVKIIRESKASAQFTWKDYLILHKNERNRIEMQLYDANNASYSLTMSTAVLLAVKMFAERDTAIKHAFTFLSYVSHEPLSLDVVVSYVLRVDKNENKEDTRLRILQCSMILPLEDDKTVSISLHRVVHDSIKLYIANVTEENTESRAPFHVLQLLLRHRFPVDEIALKHLKAFYAKTKNLSLETFVPDSMKIKQEMEEKIVQLSSGLILYGEFLLSKKFLIIAVKIATDGRDTDKLNLQNISYISFPNIGIIFSNLGHLEKELGNKTKSREYHELALNILLKQHGHSHEYVAQSYINLGFLACTEDSKKCSESIKYHELALEIDDQPEIKAFYYADQGFIHYNNGDLLIAKKYYFLAAKTFVKTKGLDESSMVVTYVAGSLTNIGYINLLLGLHEESKRALRSSIEWYLRGKRKNHVGLAFTYYHLGCVHFALNELPEAEDCLRSTLKIYSEQLEPSHEKICKVSAELAGVLNKTGQLSEAADLDKAYADICRREDHLVDP